MISCEEAATLCNKTQYKETTFFERLKLKFHLLVCKTCAKFSKQNTQFTTLCYKANLQSLTEQEKVEMKNAIRG
ncbi:hypothetical protein MNBD_BACTEROID03-2473 [hydrothermal vent metagenome]|uniref:Zinc-finger domain-containing protein n=1 Tax=hydrothermal vent metagenome TaxID=652676 RepID=A0A3B0U3J8_9ZZZZ